MRFFTTLVALALAATVSAQNSTATTASMSAQQTCLAACPSTDICCQAACVNVPCPNAAQVNATTECAAKCPQGNGTQQETQQYADCQSSCVSSYFLTATSGVPSATSGSSASSTAGSGFTSSTGSSGSSTARQTGSSTTSGSSSSSTSNAANELRAAIAGAGLFGLIVAGLAL